jgi:hypothetical protein
MTRIWATILVERESQKPFVHRARGQRRLKEVARRRAIAIETFLQNRRVLDLRVAVKEQWREDERLLDQMGMKPPEKIVRQDRYRSPTRQIFPPATPSPVAHSQNVLWLSMLE